MLKWQDIDFLSDRIQVRQQDSLRYPERHHLYFL